MTRPSFPARLIPLRIIFMVLLPLALQGCFHSSSGGGSTTPTSPVFTSDTAISVAENTTSTGYTAVATDADGDTVTYSLTGGEDQTAFSIDGDSGVLSFNTAADYENPTDTGADNLYEVEITATDGTNSVVLLLTVTVTSEFAGYYTNTGTASVSDGMGGTIEITNLQAMVSGNRIIMMSVMNTPTETKGLLYDGMITRTSDNDFTADFTIYTDGESPMSATASGTITEGAKIEGELVGSGVGSGTFSLLYASTNDQAAAVTSAWLGGGGGFFEFGFTIDDAGSLTHDESTAFNQLFGLCKMSGTVTPVSSTRLYSVSVELTGCAVPLVEGSYTGLTTTRDGTAANNLLVYSVSNGAYTVSGEFNPD